MRRAARMIAPFAARPAQHRVRDRVRLRVRGAARRLRPTRTPRLRQVSATSNDHARKTVPKGPLQIIISVDQQKLHLYSDGTHVADAPVATGVPDHPTPLGIFSIIQKSRDHRSNIYSNAPMPFMERITWSGVALHEGVNLGHPASHGCIRMSHEFAMRLWALTKLGAHVVIARPELRPEEISDPHLFVHNEQPTDAEPATSLAPARRYRRRRPAKLLKTAETDRG